jgi:hypothetical protein
MKPGMRENEAVALVAKTLYDLGSEYVEGVNAISGERCSPHPHVFSDRVMRPGDPVYYDILHSYMGYRTCYYRCFAIGSASRALVDAYKRCRDYLDASIELIRPGRTTAEVAAVWPRAQEFGFPNEEAAFALQMGHEHERRGERTAVQRRTSETPWASARCRASRSAAKSPSGWCHTACR